MKALFLIFALSTSLAQADETFMTKPNGKLKAVISNNKLWCSNGIVSFRFTIEKVDLASPAFRDSDVKIKNLLVKNDQTGKIASYVLSPEDLLDSDKTFILEGNRPVKGFPALILKSMPYSSVTKHSIVNTFEADIDENGIPTIRHSAELALNFFGTDYKIAGYQNYFGSAIRGNRLIIHCGGWDFEKEHAFDPNHFE